MKANKVKSKARNKVKNKGNKWAYGAVLALFLLGCGGGSKQTIPDPSPDPSWHKGKLQTFHPDFHGDLEILNDIQCGHFDKIRVLNDNDYTWSKGYPACSGISFFVSMMDKETIKISKINAFFDELNNDIVSFEIKQTEDPVLFSQVSSLFLGDCVMKTKYNYSEMLFGQKMNFQVYYIQDEEWARKHFFPIQVGTQGTNDAPLNELEAFVKNRVKSLPTKDEKYRPLFEPAIASEKDGSATETCDLSQVCCGGCRGYIESQLPKYFYSLSCGTFDGIELSLYPAKNNSEKVESGENLDFKVELRSSDQFWISNIKDLQNYKKRWTSFGFSKSENPKLFSNLYKLFKGDCILKNEEQESNEGHSTVAKPSQYANFYIDDVKLRTFSNPTRLGSADELSKEFEELRSYVSQQIKAGAVKPLNVK